MINKNYKDATYVEKGEKYRADSGSYSSKGNKQYKSGGNDKGYTKVESYVKGGKTKDGKTYTTKVTKVETKKVVAKKGYTAGAKKSSSSSSYTASSTKGVFNLQQVPFF
jgi:hypothetical protein